MTRRSRLDTGAFTVGEIQTMARAIGASLEEVRRLTELAVFMASLPKQSAPTDLLSVITAALDEHEDNERRWLAHVATRSREPFVWKREQHQAARVATEVRAKP